MNPPNLMALALLAALPALPAMPLRAETIGCHFDSPEEIQRFNPQWKDAAARFEPATTAAGTGAWKGANFATSFAREWPEGVLTFWVYDDHFDEAIAGKFRQMNLTLLGEADGKKQKFNLGFRRYNEGWRIAIPGETPTSRYDALSGAPNHGGWTRIDVINPAGAEPQPFTICIDGQSVFQTPEKYLSIEGVRTENLPYFDELAYDSDPNNHRPGPVRTILPGSPYGQVVLNPGQPFQVELELDAKGARAGAGELGIVMLDGRGQTLAAAKSAVAWGRDGAKRLSVELPSPPRSGDFWLETRYREPGGPVDFARRKINLQFLTPGFAQSPQMPLELFRRAWEFLPIGNNEFIQSGPSQASGPTPADLAVPAAPPADWSRAGSLSGAWLDFGSYFNIGRTYHAAWYRQRVEVPAGWRRQQILLEIEAPETIATVFANGKRAGSLEWPGGNLDLTAFATPGKILDLAIHVQAEPVSGYHKLGRETIGEKFPAPRYCAVRGLAGDVRLFPVAAGPRIDGVAVRTSVSNMNLAAVFEFSNLVPGRIYRIKAAACAAGRVAQALPETSFTAKAASDTVEVSAAWPNPVLWDLNAPHLYDLDATLLDAAGKTLANLWPERFGFREVSGDGPDLKINGRPVTLFITSGGISDCPENSRWCEKFGFSAFYEGEGKENARRLDEAGKTATGERLHSEAVQRAPLDMARNNKDTDPKFWAGIERLLEVANKVKRNHPGVFFQRGVLGGGVNGNGGMYNPCFQNGSWVNEATGSEVAMRAAAVGRRIVERLHQLDPTRLVSAQDSGSINDTMHITEYAGFLPMQEMIEKTQFWRAHGRKPFLIEEQAAPMFPNWTDACSQAEGWNGVPCFAEWAAITRGDDAYARTPLDETYLLALEKTVAQQRQKVADTVANPLERDVALAKIRMTLNPWLYRDQDEVLHNVIWKERIRDEVLNWRANNLGMLGFFFSGGGPRIDRCYQEYQAPVTGFLAGTQRQPTLKTHIFAPGETMERGALLLNNSNKPAGLTCQWRLELAGETISQGEKTATIAAGGQAFVPIEARIPAGGDRAGKLTVAFSRDGVPLRSDACDIDVIAPRAFTNGQAKVALVDPEGDSAKVLEDAGLKFQLLCFDEDFGPFDTIVFGRRAFNYELNALPEGLDLARLTRLGKRVLILEQDEATLRERFKLRTEYASPRDVYGRAGGNHPLLDGLPDRCLKSWRGSATLTDGYAVAREKKKPNSQGVHEFGNGGTWLYPWNDGELHTRPMKWGNTHNVATVVVIKPDTGNFRTLLDCGYANNYAAAWELADSNGTVVFNQLDVSGRSEPCPEARRFLQNLLRHATAATPKPAWRQAVYLGGEPGAALLKQLAIPHQTIESPSQARPERDLLVVGEAPAEQLKGWRDTIAAFARAGGSVFSLPKTAADFAAGWTPFAVKTSRRAVNHTLVGKPAAPLLAGLGNSDFYWKGNLEIVGLDALESATLRLDTGLLASVPWGRGQYVFCQIEPSRFGDVNRDHWLKDSKRTTERLIRTLLTNLDVAMDGPLLLARPRANEELDYTLDLAGSWRVCPAVPGVETCPPTNDPAWRDIRLPGSAQREHPAWKGLKGGFWYRRELPLDREVPRDIPLRMVIGCISGANIVYVNGVKLARTDSETDVNSVATTLRDYPLPGSAFKTGSNEIVLRVDYDTNAALGMRGSTGEVAAPMELKVPKSKTRIKIPEPIELETRSECWGVAVADSAAPCPDLNRTGTTLPWHRLAVPAYIQPQQSDWANLTGYFWYWKPFQLTEALPEGAQPVLIMGAVDDEDTTYFNGVKIGHTGKDTHPKDYWKARRSYPIPRELFKPGTNIIKVQVHDFDVGGGICAGPFRIIFEDPATTRKRKLAQRPYLYDVGRKDDPYWHHGF